jgi:hypothetical protein
MRFALPGEQGEVSPGTARSAAKTRLASDALQAERRKNNRKPQNGCLRLRSPHSERLMGGLMLVAAVC